MYQYRETEHAEYIIKNGFSKKYLSSQLKILAMYYRDKDVPPKKRKELLYKLCKKFIKDFNKVKFFSIINSAITYSNNKKNQLLDIDYIPITSEEYNFIDNLQLDITYKKILFAYIVMDKLNEESKIIKYGTEPNGEHYFKNNERRYSEILKTSGVTKPTLKKLGHNNMYDINHYLIKKGLVEDTIENIKLLFIYDIPTTDDIATKITDYDNIGLYYDLHIGIKNIKKCEECGKPIRVKSNRTKYCETCKTVKWNEYNAKKQREYRKNN